MGYYVAGVATMSSLSYDFAHVLTVSFCFMHLVQKSLNEVKNEWNAHRIRPSRNTNVPGGIPDQLFFVPASEACNFNIECLKDEAH